MQGAKKNIIRRITLLFAIVVLAASCSSISVTTDWDSETNFSKFKTFVVLENTDQSINRLTNQRIRTAVVSELTSRGLQQVDSQEMADLAIAYTVATEQRTSFQTVHSSMGGVHGLHHNNIRNVRFRGAVGTSRSRMTQHNYTVGTLIIGVYQMGNKELVWEGSASDTVNTTSRSPEQNQQHINDAVQQILKDFPPGVTD